MGGLSSARTISSMGSTLIGLYLEEAPPPLESHSQEGSRVARVAVDAAVAEVISYQDGCLWIVFLFGSTMLKSRYKLQRLAVAFEALGVPT